VTKQLLLMDLENHLKYKKYDELGLRFLGSLRSEVGQELEFIKKSK